MTDLERRARAALPQSRQARFDFLLALRTQIARITAELVCWGVGETPGMDRQLRLVKTPSSV